MARIRRFRAPQWLRSTRAYIGKCAQACVTSVVGFLGWAAKKWWLYAGFTAVGILFLFFDKVGAELASRFSSIIHKIDPAVAPNFVITFPKVDIPVPQSFMLGVAESSLASVWFAWTAYLNRGWLRSIFRPPLVRLFAPMSVAITPVILARQRNMWDANDINLELDFSMTGNRALEALGDGKCQIAVAGDYTICHFFGTAEPLGRDNWEEQEAHPYIVVPFARLHNEVKLLTRPKLGSGDAPRLDELQGKCLAYWPNSIHQEFLNKSKWQGDCANSSPMSDKAALINFIAQVATGEAAACVLVEPYFLALEKAGFKIVETEAKMDWYMCAVMKKDSFEKYAETERRFRRVMTEACQAVDRERGEALKLCARYVLSEFTGIDGDTLVANMVPDETDLEKPWIDFQRPLKVDFLHRIRKLQSEPDEVGRGASSILFYTACVKC